MRRMFTLSDDLFEDDADFEPLSSSEKSLLHPAKELFHYDGPSR